MTHTEYIRVRGLVQGVGFRPTVWHLARTHELKGSVSNDGEGVVIIAQGSELNCQAFIHALEQQAPVLARIESIERQVLNTTDVFSDFSIIESSETQISTGIVPDAATCADCLAEINDPANHRYRYPFTNCTHCGPRLSIVEAIPYDRANTSMQNFAMCERCKTEYTDPQNRRFHAQPNACPDCGPVVWLEDLQGQRIELPDDPQQDAVQFASDLLREGRILAIKGIGGFHLCCDASNEQSVALLRERKRRYQKPLAMMARDLHVIAKYVSLDDAARHHLSIAAAPIVLLPRLRNSTLASAIAPMQTQLGFMLPYSPLHHLLLQAWETPLVMTSANLTDEPQCTENQEVTERLQAIADVCLMHDRHIVNRVDDSVLRIDNHRPRFLRRARGYAPAPISLPAGFEPVRPLIALGGELKSSICLLQPGQAIVSQHLGDLEDARTFAAFEQTLGLYQKLFDHQPECIVIDHHPEYLSSKFGRDWAERENLSLLTVQHHHAHIASVMADNGHPLTGGPVLGVALDGLGFGLDGSLWGGEFLHCDYHHSTRLARLMPAAMPGGSRAMLEPWRNTWAQLKACEGWQESSQRYAGLELFKFLQRQPLKTLDSMLDRGLNCPLSSSCGRLFDAVAAAVGICIDQASYEGQAAIELEGLLQADAADSSAYPFEIDQQGELLQINSARMWQALLQDLEQGVQRAEISARFHNGLVAAIIEMVTALCEVHQLQRIALSGGVFQNRYLLTQCENQISARGLKYYSHHQVPANDGGLSLGQAVIAAVQRTAI